MRIDPFARQKLQDKLRAVNQVVQTNMAVSPELKSSMDDVGNSSANITILNAITLQVLQDIQGILMDISEKLDQPLCNCGILTTPNQEGNLYLVIHANTKLNSEDKAKGWMDIPLDEFGKKQAQDLGEKLKSENIQHVFSSDLGRAKDTAQAITDATGAPLEEVTRELKPWDIGDLVGLDGDEAQKILDDHEANSPEKSLPKGESFNDFKGRFLQKIKDLMDQYPGKNIAVVTHRRNDRLLEAWKMLGAPEDLSVSTPTPNAEEVEPATFRKIPYSSLTTISN